MPYRLQDLIDIEAFARALEALHQADGIPSAIIDTKGNVLTGAGWQRICTEFHRKHPKTLVDCIASDIRLNQEIADGAPSALYECPRGLVDSCAAIFIEGQRVGNVFTGQVFTTPHTEERVEAFRQQAERFGFDEEAYLAALREVPIVPEDRMRAWLGFMVELAEQLASIGLAHTREIETSIAVAERERTYRLLLDHTNTAAWALDLETLTFTWVDPKVEAVTGFPVEAWTNFDAWAAMLHPEDRAHATETCQTATALGEDHVLVYRTIDPSGRLRWIQDVVAVLTGETGPDRLLGFFRDITETKLQEKAKQDLEARLRRAEKMEALGTLAGGIAHDFNNVLGAILGFAEIAERQTEANPALRENVEEIITASKRAKALVRRILTFSRVGSGPDERNDLTRVVTETARLLRGGLPTTIEIEVTSNQQNGTWVRGAAEKLQQIILNLGTNAAHAMRDQGGRLRFEVLVTKLSQPTEVGERTLDPGSYAILACGDDGHGMAPEVAERIFEPYFTTKSLTQGTGLGLAVVHGIVHELGGAIRVESKPGAGTSFEIYLPLVDPPETQPARAPVVVDDLSGNEAILVVDDEPSLVRVIRRVLEPLGYRVTTETDSHAALALFAEQPASFDLLVTDQTMHGLRGDQLIERIRELRPNLPVVLCTGYSDQIDEQQAAARGIDGFLMKPVEAEELMRTIRKVLNRR